MASSNLMLSVSSDPRQLQNDFENSRGGSMSLDGILENSSSEASLLNGEITLLDEVGAIMPIHDSSERKRTVDEVWRGILEGNVEESKRKMIPGCKAESMDEMMTLEDFLVNAGAVDESEIEGGEVKIESGGVYGFDGSGVMVGHSSLGGGSGLMYMGGSGSGSVVSLDGIMGYGDGVEQMRGSQRMMRGKRRVSVLENSMDKATQQRQRRMIKNRESAARSRERKEAYQVELETMAARLEEKNEMLLKEKAERTKERFKQLVENVIPVLEKRRPARVLRRVRSMEL